MLNDPVTEGDRVIIVVENIVVLKTLENEVNLILLWLQNYFISAGKIARENVTMKGGVRLEIVARL